MASTRMSARDVSALVREVTDEEVAFYQEHGWVRLPGLVAPDLAEELRLVGEERHARGQGEYLGMQPEAEPYPSFLLSETMARNAHRLITRKWVDDDDAPIRFQGDTFAYREPTPAGETRQGWHQDSPEHGTDRVGEMKF
jgi:hypothetical protein